MKRFHVHLHDDDLAKSIAFYSQLLAAEPARIETKAEVAAAFCTPPPPGKPVGIAPVPANSSCC